MRSIRRLPWLPSVLGAIALLAGIAAAGLGDSDGPERPSHRSATAITAAAYIGSASTAPETRLGRDIESGKGQRGPRHDSSDAAASAAPQPRSRIEALAAVLEEAGHPERTGHILLRGPPAATA